MSPNSTFSKVSPKVSARVDEEILEPPKRLEIIYQDYYYDVTDFVKKHPGGSVIHYYTENGEDATHAIQQFHNRSMNKIELMLQSFKKRPVMENQQNIDQKLARNRALTNDFAKLFVDITKEGMFEPSYWRIAWAILEPFLFWYISYILIFSPNLALKAIGCICNALGSGRAGYAMHEGGHLSLSGKPKVDRFIENVLWGGFWGLSGKWWTRTHIKHHAMPQRLDHDQDLETLPFLLYNYKVAKDPKQAQTFFVQNQSWLYLTLDCFLCHLIWTINSCPKFMWKHKDYFGFLMMAIHWTANYILIPNLYCFIFIYWLRSTYIIGNFSLAHSHRTVTDEPTHWVEYALTHTCNIHPSLVVDWWTGYLNLHIEHHLFPTLPEFRLHLIQDRVQALAKKHGLPYQIDSYMRAWARTIQNFRDVANHFKAV